MSLILLFTVVPVYAEEDTKQEDDITVTTKQSCYTPTDENNEVIGETVYTLSALTRDYDQKIDMPIEHELGKRILNFGLTKDRLMKQS